MLPVPIPQMHAMALPPRYQQLPGVEMKLQNKELWRDFHKIGTEMIITKCGRLVEKLEKLNAYARAPTEMLSLSARVCWMDFNWNALGSFCRCGQDLAQIP
ncbi:hypothetical protein quinque_003249 [Culex quinquefasciatus]